METQENEILVFNTNDLNPIDRGFYPIIDKMIISKPNTCIYLGYYEYELPGGNQIFETQSFFDLQKYCDENNINFHFVLNANDVDYYSKYKSKFTEKILISSWPTFYLHHTYHQLIGDSIRDRLPDLNLEQKFDKLYVLFNNRPHYHRQLLMDKLCENNLLDCGRITWNILTKNYHHNVEDLKFNCWNEQTMFVDNFNLSGNYGITYEYIIDGISNCLINLVSESTTNCEFITEKTFKPILVGQPFLCFGSKNQNKLLLKYGFELYDEIFDYDFDKKENLGERCLGIIENLNRIKNENYLEIYNKLKPKINKNRKVAYSILNKDEHISKIFINTYKKNTFPFSGKVETFMDTIMKNITNVVI